jgi:hypothetical protein
MTPIVFPANSLTAIPDSDQKAQGLSPQSAKIASCSNRQNMSKYFAENGSKPRSLDHVPIEVMGWINQ